MQKSPTLVRLLAAGVIALQGAACGLVRTGTADLPVAGSTSSDGGSDPASPGVTGGGGGLPGSGGSSPVGGSTASAGSAGSAGASGGTEGDDGGAGGAGGEPTKIILFDGSEESFDGWVSMRNGGSNPWKNNGDGTMTVASTTGDIQTKQKFKNVFVHLEYMAPQTSVDTGSEVGNASGDVFLNGSYGLRMTDSYGLPPTDVSCGSVFGYHAPFAVACHELGAWNTYEIEFQAPTCDNLTIVTPARFVEVDLNGTPIHRNVDVLQPTQAGQHENCEPRGLRLQDYAVSLPVSFRKIWAISRD